LEKKKKISKKKEKNLFLKNETPNKTSGIVGDEKI